MSYAILPLVGDDLLTSPSSTGNWVLTGGTWAFDAFTGLWQITPTVGGISLFITLPTGIYVPDVGTTGATATCGFEVNGTVLMKLSVSTVAHAGSDSVVNTLFDSPPLASAGGFGTIFDIVSLPGATTSVGMVCTAVRSDGAPFDGSEWVAFDPSDFLEQLASGGWVMGGQLASAGAGRWIAGSP